MATHSSILACRIPMDRGALWAAVHGVAKTPVTKHSTAVPHPGQQVAAQSGIPAGDAGRVVPLTGNSSSPGPLLPVASGGQRAGEREWNGPS